MKRTLRLFPLFLVVVFVVLSGCQGKATYENISIDQAKQMIDDGQVHVIDVRTEEEYREGHIPGAKLIPVQQLQERLDELNKAEHYLIVCRSGNRSAQASEILLETGFKNIYNLELGMNEWRGEIET